METEKIGLLNLAGAGVEFTLPKRGDKQPFTKGWPDYRPELATVGRHLERGGNLGVHANGYTDGWKLAYFDGDDSGGIAALLAVRPALAESLRSWRESGSGKIFVWVHDPGDVLRNQSTPNLNGPHTKREFKVSGQATIFGVHPSGERYETNWAAPIVVTVDEVIATCEAWTGQEWVDGRKRERVEPGQGYTRRDGDDVERVKAAWTPSAVFAHHWPGCQIVKERGGELRILGKGGLLCNDDDGLWHSFAENIGGDVFNAWAWVTNRHIDTDFPAILREMADAKGIVITPPKKSRRDGDTPDGGGTPGDGDTPDGDTIPAQINHLRLHLRTGDFAEIVPEYHPTETDANGNPRRLQSVTGYRTGDVDRVVADAAMGYLWELGRVEARISNLELSGRTGYSPNTCGAAMRRLCRLFEPVDAGDKGKAAQTYRIPDALLCDTDSPVLGVSQSSALPLATHRTADVFVRSLSALTETQVAERDERRRLAELPPMKRTRMLAKRLGAAADALGPAVLRLVDVLYQYGPLPARSISPLLFKSDTQTRRVVTKAIRAGLVEQPEPGVFGLVDDWRERSHELSRTCPLAGVVHERRVQAADNRLRYCEQALAQCQPARHKELQIRKRRAEAEKWRLSQMEADAYNERASAAGLAPITSAAVIRPGRGETFAQWQKRRLMDTRSADAAIRAFAPTLRGLDRATAEQMAYYAGYSNYEFARAWALRSIA